MRGLRLVFLSLRSDPSSVPALQRASTICRKRPEWVLGGKKFMGIDDEIREVVGGTRPSGQRAVSMLQFSNHTGPDVCPFTNVRTSMEIIDRNTNVTGTFHCIL